VSVHKQLSLPPCQGLTESYDLGQGRALPTELFSQSFFVSVHKQLSLPICKLIQPPLVALVCGDKSKAIFEITKRLNQIFHQKNDIFSIQSPQSMRFL